MVSSSSYSRSALGSSQSHRHDVFLSFRGDDTRVRFVDHLYTALVHKQINTFKDDKRFLPGESICPSLFTAIEESHIALVVFSKNYADSSWCLEELAYIMKCKEERGLIVMPIFYNVEPRDVRKQKRKFGEAFDRHENENTTKVKSWRKALADASNNVGFDSKNRHESGFIKEIVDTIFDRLLSLNSYVDEDFVGMPTRIQDLKSRLDIGSDGVRIVGIWGVGGGGKTTLATSVYMEISHHFEGSCIVENIREESSRYGLKKLQENILSAVYSKEVKVPNVVEGKHKIKSMLCRRKVLLLLDDVDQLGQLEALAGSHNWFGSGSRIIITTRDEHLINTHKVNDIYRVKLLSDDEAVQLFNKHAYNEKDPLKDYMTLSLRVASYAAGLPLALKVLGSFLYDKDEKEWISALDRLNDIPEKEIVEKIKISYDGLEKEEKELFLDIACFFRGHSSTYAQKIFEACGFHPVIGIKVLRQKSLITINSYGCFEMHDLVQEMGHYIVRREHPNNPENHTRLWKREEIRNIWLGDATKTNYTIEAIGEYRVEGDEVSRFCNNVSNMKRLRWLRVESWNCYEYNIDGGPNFLSNELRYIEWDGYPGVSFPDNFQPVKLVVLKLYGGLQEVLWKGYKDLPCLKVLHLRRMMSLVSTPDFKGLPCLQKLTLFECHELEEIHPSLGNHKSLKYVSVSLCGKLRKFPTIVRMEKLRSLEIKGCYGILEFPEIQSNIESLVNLSLEKNGIQVLPSSIGEHCTNLTSLYVKHGDALKSIEFKMDALKHLKEFKYSSHFNTQLPLYETRFYQFSRSLQKLELSICGLEDGKILSGIVELSNLEELDLSWNDFPRLDFSLLHLTRLKILNLTGCKRLLELPQLPSSVTILNADYCHSLTTIGDSLTYCKCLCQVSFDFGGIINDGNKVLQSMLQGKGIENRRSMVLRLEGGLEIAKWFTPYLRNGSRCRLELPENWRNEFCGFLMCSIEKSTSTFNYDHAEITVEHVKSGPMDSEHEVDWKESGSDGNTWVGYVSFASLRDNPWWDLTYNQLFFRIQYDFTSINAFGVILVGKKSESGSGLTDFSQFSYYTPCFSIRNVSAYGLKICFPRDIQ